MVDWRAGPECVCVCGCVRACVRECVIVYARAHARARACVGEEGEGSSEGRGGGNPRGGGAGVLPLISPPTPPASWWEERERARERERETDRRLLLLRPSACSPPTHTPPAIYSPCTQQRLLEVSLHLTVSMHVFVREGGNVLIHAVLSQEFA